MSAIDRITVSPDVCGGRPCVRGLRVRIKDVAGEALDHRGLHATARGSRWMTGDLRRPPNAFGAFGRLARHQSFATRICSAASWLTTMGSGPLNRRRADP